MFLDHFKVLVECISWQRRGNLCFVKRIKMSPWWNEAITPCGALHTCRAHLLQTNIQSFQRRKSWIYFIVCSLNLGPERNENGRYLQRKSINCIKEIWKIPEYLAFLKARLLNYWELEMKWSSSATSVSLASPLTALLGL